MSAVFEQRLRAVELRMERNTTMLEDIHLAVVGDGSPGSSLRERMASAESDIATINKHIPSWRSRAIQTSLQMALSIAAGYFGIHLPTAPHQG